MCHIKYFQGQHCLYKVDSGILARFWHNHLNLKSYVELSAGFSFPSFDKYTVLCFESLSAFREMSSPVVCLQSVKFTWDSSICCH